MFKSLYINFKFNRKVEADVTLGNEGLTTESLKAFRRYVTILLHFKGWRISIDRII